MERLIRPILWWVIYLLAWYKSGFLFAVIIAVLITIYGLLNYYLGGKYVTELYEKK